MVGVAGGNVHTIVRGVTERIALVRGIAQGDTETIAAEPRIAHVLDRTGEKRWTPTWGVYAICDLRKCCVDLPFYWPFAV